MVCFFLKAECAHKQMYLVHNKRPPNVDLKKDCGQLTLGCALFSIFFVELDELSSGVPNFLKSDHGKLLRLAILCLVTWMSRGTCVMVS